MSGGAYRSLDTLNQYFPGFISLVRFFDTAANRRLNPCVHHCPLPVELYYRILDFTDEVTYLSYARVSTVFRRYCQKTYRIGGKKAVVKNLDPMDLAVIDRESRSGTDVRRTDYEGLTSCNYSPIVGLQRPSILDQIYLSVNGKLWNEDLPLFKPLPSWSDRDEAEESDTADDYFEALLVAGNMCEVLDES